MQTGDVILIPFPFSDFNQAKLRPAVLICETSDEYKDLVLAAITSVLHYPLFSNEILLRASEVNGLRVDSILRCDRIMTLKSETACFKIGQLEEDDLEAFKLVFKNLVEALPRSQQE
jgi:mRNA interferase MazF